jgi:hypothetical protein
MSDGLTSNALARARAVAGRGLFRRFSSLTMLAALIPVIFANSR